MQENNLKFRQINHSDASALLLIRNSPSTYKYFLNSEAITSYQHEKWFSKQLLNPNNSLIVEQNNQIIGFCYIQNEEGKNYISLYISSSFRKIGIGTELIKQFLLCIPEEIKKNLFSIVHKKNLASQKLFEKLRFERIQNFSINSSDFWIYKYRDLDSKISI